MGTDTRHQATIHVHHYTTSVRPHQHWPPKTGHIPLICFADTVDFQCLRTVAPAAASAAACAATRTAAASRAAAMVSSSRCRPWPPPDRIAVIAVAAVASCKQQTRAASARGRPYK